MRSHDRGSSQVRVIPGGYFPKRTAAGPAWLEAAHVREVCSVSECLSSGPPEWIAHWRHNDWGWYNALADARAVIPPGGAGTYRVFAYRMHDEEFRADGRRPLQVPANIDPEPVPPGFRRLGFDVFSKSLENGVGPECSPLSCNGLAAEIAVNEYCLLPSLAVALEVAERFAREQPEPGSYYVVEVLRASADADA